MCCLKNEEETYEVLNSKLPNPGDYVTTSDGLKGEVHSVNVLRQQVKVIVTVERDEKEIREYKVDQLKFKPRKKKGKGGGEKHGATRRTQSLSSWKLLRRRKESRSWNDN